MNDLIGCVQHDCAVCRAAGWIETSVRLPDTDAPVLIAYRAGYKTRKTKIGASPWSIITARYAGGEWRFLSSKQKNRLAERIHAWQPLPSPPHA